MFLARVCRYICFESILVPLLVLQVLQIILVPPADHSSNDDWMYGKMVSALIQEHRYIHDPIVLPTSVAHVLIGGLFVSALGEGYDSLRYAVLTLALIGAWAAARCAMACGLPRRCALLTGMIVAANPLYMNLSNTFMTDVSYMTFVSLSALFYLKAIRTEKAKYLFVGGLLGAAGFFVRQFGVIPAASYAIVAAVIHFQQRRWPGLKAMVAYSIPWIAALIGYFVWRQSFERSFKLNFGLSHEAVGFRLVAFLTYLIVIATLMGIYLLPISAARLHQLIVRRERWTWARWSLFLYCACLFGAVFAFYLRTGMPQPGNILHTFGIGPHTIGGKFIVSPVGLKTISAVWIIVTVLGILSASLMIAGRISFTARSRRTLLVRPAHELFLGIWLLLLLFSSYNSFTPYPFDRYSMPMIVPLSILGCGWVARHSARWTILTGGICAMIMFGCSLAALQDYQAWSRARWEAVDYLVSDMKIPRESIHGGSEFIGIFIPVDKWVENYTLKLPSGGTMVIGKPRNEPYVVMFSPPPGFTIIKKFPYYSWLAMDWRSVYALKRPER
jgi:hypothetical protein